MNKNAVDKKQPTSMTMVQLIFAPKIKQYTGDSSWNIVNDHLASIMMDKPAKPLSAKHKNYCQCSKRKCTKNCSCAAAGVNCIVSCKCTANPRLCARIAEDSEDDERTTITSVLFKKFKFTSNYGGKP